MTEDAGGQNLTVAVRLRPLNKREEQKKVAKVVRSSQNRVVVSAGARGGPDRTYNYDKVFSPYATQEHVFDSLVSPVVDEVLAGFNCTVFAYGPTGTGKTHTMEGSLEEPAEMGLIPRCARALYERLERRDADFQVKASCLEVYNEELSDLLDDAAGAARPSSGGGGSAAMASATAKPGAGKRALRLVQTAGEGAVTCANLEEVACGTLDDCVQVLRRGSRARHTAATLCNDKSSRSHAIYTLKVCVRTLTEDGRDLVVNGQLNLVDLAGSECVGRSGATAGRAREAGSINQSLLSLGRVIAALVSGGDSKYVPYRDSKLTRLLQDSLGGRAKTTLIATVSPGRDACDETLSTLQYALRARSITNKPEQHARYHGKALVKAHAKEVDDLQRLLAAQRDKQGGVLVPADQWDDMQNLLANKKAELEELGEALAESREARVAAEKAYDDERERADDERIKREAAEERLAIAERERDDAKAALEAEARAHAETRAVERARAAAEARLLDDGAQLKGAVTACAADLDAASAELAGTLAAARDRAAGARDLADLGRRDAAPQLDASLGALEAALAARCAAAEAAADALGAGVRDGALATCVAGFSAAVAGLVGDVRAAAAADADASARRKAEWAAAAAGAARGADAVRAAAAALAGEASARAAALAATLDAVAGDVAAVNETVHGSLTATLAADDDFVASKLVGLDDDAAAPTLRGARARLEANRAARVAMDAEDAAAVDAFRATEARQAEQGAAELARAVDALLAAEFAKREARLAAFGDALADRRATRGDDLAARDAAARAGFDALADDALPAWRAAKKRGLEDLAATAKARLDAAVEALPRRDVAALAEAADAGGAAAARAAAAATEAAAATARAAADRLDADLADAAATREAEAARAEAAARAAEARARGDVAAAVAEAAAATAAAAAACEPPAAAAKAAHAAAAARLLDAADAHAAAAAADKTTADADRGGAPHRAARDAAKLEPAPPRAAILAAAFPAPRPSDMDLDDAENAPPAPPPPGKALSTPVLPPAPPKTKSPLAASNK